MANMTINGIEYIDVRTAIEVHEKTTGKAVYDAQKLGHREGYIAGNNHAEHAHRQAMDTDGEMPIKLEQYDAWINDEGDDVRGYADEHGDLYSGGYHTQMRRSDDDLTVRVYLSEKATQEIAVRQLKAIIEFIEQDGRMTAEKEAVRNQETKEYCEYMISGMKWQQQHPEYKSEYKQVVEDFEASKEFYGNGEFQAKQE